MASFGGSAVLEIGQAAQELGIQLVVGAVKQALHIYSYQRTVDAAVLRDQRGVEVDIDF